jgi:hypothetical protein
MVCVGRYSWPLYDVGNFGSPPTLIEIKAALASAEPVVEDKVPGDSHLIQLIERCSGGPLQVVDEDDGNRPCTVVQYSPETVREYLRSRLNDFNTHLFQGKTF